MSVGHAYRFRLTVQPLDGGAGRSLICFMVSAAYRHLTARDRSFWRRRKTGFGSRNSASATWSFWRAARRRHKSRRPAGRSVGRMDFFPLALSLSIQVWLTYYYSIPLLVPSSRALYVGIRTRTRGGVAYVPSSSYSRTLQCFQWKADCTDGGKD